MTSSGNSDPSTRPDAPPPPPPSPPGQGGDTVILTLRLPAGADCRRLAPLLKSLLRRFGLVCVEIRPSKDDDDDASRRRRR